MLINYIDGGILSQCKCVPNHHSVHFKYLTILNVTYTSIKLNSFLKNEKLFEIRGQEAMISNLCS